VPAVSRRLIGVIAAAALAAVPAAVGARDPAPAGLPLPTGLRLLDARAGGPGDAFRWTATYRSGARSRDIARYARRVERTGRTVLRGPGAVMTFRFRRWQVTACGEAGCAAPPGRITLAVGIPGG
jgi:hypothetical protein